MALVSIYKQNVLTKQFARLGEEIRKYNSNHYFNRKYACYGSGNSLKPSYINAANLRIILRHIFVTFIQC